ncbi:unnamed protein product [Trichogramma brassicae]|uniref:Uncharacterized protein n=1 Tax=Trichogramma brassicae TaxID=86971 RepID=A0A6H5JBX8_9HYME|nr:unnamed protein product [Trichogramma brassicae]
MGFGCNSPETRAERSTRRDATRICIQGALRGKEPRRRSRFRVAVAYNGAFAACQLRRVRCRTTAWRGSRAQLPTRWAATAAIDDHVLCDGFLDCPGSEDEGQARLLILQKPHSDSETVNASRLFPLANLFVMPNCGSHLESRYAESRREEITPDPHEASFSLFTRYSIYTYIEADYIFSYILYKGVDRLVNSNNSSIATTDTCINK